MALPKLSKIELNIKLLILTLFLILSSTALHTFLVETNKLVPKNKPLRGQVLQASSNYYLGGPYVLPSEQHPSLFLFNSEINTLRARRDISPYNQWYEAILSQANGSYESLETAIAVAFAYYIEGNNTYGVRAADRLDNYNSGFEGERWFTRGHYLQQYAVAYDLIAGMPDSVVSASEKQVFRNVLIDEAEWADGSLRNWGNGNVRSAGNGNFKPASGLALAALALADHPSADQWLRDALRYHQLYISGDNSMDAVRINEEPPAEQDGELVGGFAWDGLYLEGPAYFNFVMENFMPFMLGYYHATGVNVATEPMVQEMFDAIIKISFPDGTPSTYDDANYIKIYSDLIVGLLPERAGWHRWRTENYSTPSTGSDYKLARRHVYYFTMYDDSISSTQPNINPSMVFEDNSHVIFRKDWSADSSFMHVIGRNHAPADSHGQSDQTSFTVYAHKMLLAVDSGYGGAIFRYDSTIGDSWAHNMITVDGENQTLNVDGTTIQAMVAPCPFAQYASGWDRVDKTFLKEYSLTPFIDSSSHEITYRHDHTNYGHLFGPIDITRTAIYLKDMGLSPDNEYFIIADNVEAPATHTYDWILHGPNDNITSSSSNHRTWEIQQDRYVDANSSDTISFTVYLANPGSISERSSIHTYPNKGNRTRHTYIKAHKTNLQNTQYLALLYPRNDARMAEPNLSHVTGSTAEGIRLDLTEGADNLVDIVYFKDNNNTETIEDITSDARLGLRRVHNSNLIYYLLKDGTQFDSNLVNNNSSSSHTLINSTGELTSASLRYNENTNTLEGEIICGVDICNLIFYPREGSGSAVRTLQTGSHIINIPFSEFGEPSFPSPSPTAPTPTPPVGEVDPTDPPVFFATSGCYELVDGAVTLGSLECVFENAIKAFLGLAAIILFVVILVAGFKYVTSGGDPKAVQSAKMTLTYAIGGMVLIALSFLILQFISVFTGADVTDFRITQ